MAKKTYILEHDDPKFWREVRIRAEIEGTTIKNKILDLLRKWIDKKG